MPRPGDPALDLCRRHLASLLRAFTPRKTPGIGRTKVDIKSKLEAIEERRARDRERHRAITRKRQGERVHISQKHSPRVSRETFVKSGRYGNGHAPWNERMTFLLGVMPAVGQTPTIELRRRAAKEKAWERLQMSDNLYGLVLAKLKQAGLIVQHGTRRLASYGRATPREGMNGA